MENLTDLESLVLRVRTPRSQENIKEAVRAYYGGAYRAAIVSTWIAVVDDLIEKIKELSAYEDPEASKISEELHNNIGKNNINWLQSFESGILECASNKFELISQDQLINLKRIQKDRHLCAHPAYTETGGLFEPTPEQVRTHIIHAATHVLQHAPVRGKSSLKAIIEDIQGEAFPQSAPDVVGKYLRKKYLEYAKPSLTSNLLSILIKALLNDLEDWQGYRPRASTALKGLAHTETKAFDTWIMENLEKTSGKLSGDGVLRLLGLVAVDLRIWNWIGEPQRIKLIDFFQENKVPTTTKVSDDVNGWLLLFSGIDYVVKDSEKSKLAKKLGLNALDDLFLLLGIKELRPLLLNAFYTLSDEDKLSAIAKHPCADFSDEAIKLYQSACSFRDAESLGQGVLLPLAPYFSEADIQKICEVISNNGQIFAAGGTQGILINWIDELENRDDITLKGAANWNDFMIKLSASYDHYQDLQQHLEDKSLI